MIKDENNITKNSCINENNNLIFDRIVLFLIFFFGIQNKNFKNILKKLNSLIHSFIYSIACCGFVFVCVFCLLY